MKDETGALIVMFRNLGEWWDRWPEQSGAFIRGSQARKDIASQIRYYKRDRGRTSFKSTLLTNYGKPRP